MTEPLMTQALQLLVVVAVGMALAFYGHVKGVREREKERRDQPAALPPR
jgi:hypothetical protein